MNSTQAIREAVTFIQWTLDYMENSDDWNEVNTHPDHAKLQEVIAQLQRLPQASGSIYGTLWSIEDLRGRRPSWSDEKLTAWMESNKGNLSDRQAEDGWETIGTLLEIDGMCEGCGKARPDTEFYPSPQHTPMHNTLCDTCCDDYEITRCSKCDHVIRRDHIDDDICQLCS